MDGLPYFLEEYTKERKSLSVENMVEFTCKIIGL